MWLRGKPDVEVHGRGRYVADIMKRGWACAKSLLSALYPISLAVCDADGWHTQTKESSTSRRAQFRVRYLPSDNLHVDLIRSSLKPEYVF